MSSFQYRNPHVKDKTLTWDSPYLGKTVFILRRGPGRYPPPIIIQETGSHPCDISGFIRNHIIIMGSRGHCLGQHDDGFISVSISAVALIRDVCTDNDVPMISLQNIRYAKFQSPINHPCIILIHEFDKNAVVSSSGTLFKISGFKVSTF